MNSKKNPPKVPATSNPDRRNFLRNIALGGGVGLAGLSGTSNAADLTVPDWSRKLGPGVAETVYGQPSQHESRVIRKWLPWVQVARESSVSFTPLHKLSGTITPNGLFFERHHAGIPDIDPTRHSLALHGLVERPLVFSLQDLKRFPSVSAIHFIECAANTALEWKRAQANSLQFSHGMLSNCEWTGVPLKLLLQEAGLKPGAKWLLAESADASAYARSIPLEKALDDVIVAFAQNGEALRPEQGYPVRLVVPGWEGSTSIKWLRRLKIGDRPWHTREETARYSDLMADGRSRLFTFVQEAKSVITSPCPEAPLLAKGMNAISGLAWSGRGRISGVDVSLDGGRNWQEAKLQGPVLPKALTRFSLPWIWDGKEALLQSRARDETGYVQPTIAMLRTQRGGNSIYHNNMIMTWQVKAGGEVQNVQLD
jgi:sulfane dehydrogenase subunit SoxC